MDTKEHSAIFTQPINKVFMDFLLYSSRVTSMNISYLRTIDIYNKDNWIN